MTPRERAHVAPQPLSGIRILDLTRLLPGPWSTMLLADLGAEVIKIENPDTGGDPSRSAQPRYAGNAGKAGEDRVGESVYFCNVNRNKSSIALDLKREAARASSRWWRGRRRRGELRAGAADRMGIGYEALRERRPSLVYCAITGYGQHGPLAAMPATISTSRAMRGSCSSMPTSRPRMPNVLMGDFASATAALAAILAGLVAARTTRRAARSSTSRCSTRCRRGAAFT